MCQRILFAFITSAIVCTTTMASTLLDGVAVVVNGTPITIHEIRQANEDRIAAARQLSGEEYQHAMEEILGQGARQLVERKIIEDYARRNRIQVESQQVEEAISQVAANNNISRDELERRLGREGISMSAYRDDIRIQLIMMQIGQRMEENLRVSDKEAEEAFREGRFQQIHYADVGHILITADGKTDEQAKAIARRLWAEIEAGEINFADAARQYSEGPNAADGGLMENVRRGRLLQELDQAIFGLDAGDMDMVSSTIGYHLIKVHDRDINREMRSEDLERTRELLLQQKQQERMEALLDDLLEKAVVSYKIPGVE
ncbi:peptidylprolyl isomerase [Desulfurispira natronophila]|uniref:Parvulin-like peptidyl-prolyl isomerase n=1 Tax=Desulfurispira natronophila TaxID=682562 RepID=A0A7W7Y4G9_9BACT|nr:peptidylprolyl isomerase [Desulfurispira natronophila]MBB5021874.1 parvulin-like peptidyl-prolyl isomerase [Desulfurispira natronophila]